ncbi:MAG: peptide/nickel transport system permease protein [Gaiellales bacterium]|nr:peptide/nickel transport system permease protein [Gaiellales bacterium]MDX6593102.1 peptide/nickel transport system permease protein [Gaiellales bacterium]
MNRFLGGIWGFILRRLLLGLFVLLIVSVIVFVATQALGDPARAILGRQATPESLKALQEQLGLDKPLLTQYWDWLTGILQGDAGTSLAAQIPITEYLSDRVVNSAFLVLLAGGISIPLSIAIGAYAALRRDGKFDTGTSIVTLAFAALPEFAVGLILVVLFSTTVFNWLPAIAAPGVRPWNDLEGMILPTATLVVAVTPYVVRIMRASMIEVLESEYVEMARLKGLPERLVLVRHALPNALGPTFQVIAISLAYLAGGVIVVEFLFNFPGIGFAMADAVNKHDIPAVQALAMLIAALYVVLNLMADVATILTTPKLRGRL